MVRRFTTLRMSIFSLAALGAAGMAVAEPTWYVVTGDEAQVRCGADSSYYPFTIAGEGDLVMVVGEKYNWARVRAVGNVFEDGYGYVKYPSSELGRFELAANGNSGRTLGATPVLAPNMNADDLAHSWRQLCILPSGESLQVMETFTVEDDGLHAVPHTVHRVALPEMAEGWINMADLRPATESDMNPPVIGGEEVVEVRETTVVVTEEVIEGTDVVIVEDEESVEETVITLIASEPPPLMVQWVEYADAEEALEMAMQEAMATEEENKEVPSPLAELESRYEGVVLADLDAEELECLYEDFIVVSEEEPDPVRAEYARIRARQIQVYVTLNDQEDFIRTLQSRIDRSQVNAAERELAIASTGDYEVVGMLTTSAVFNGDDRPEMYRVQDPTTGRTLAYLRPQQSPGIKDMLGQNIGVMGLIAYEPSMQINIIKASRIDLMASNTAYVPVD